MNRRRLLRVTAFLLPVLLLWIVILGEANRSLDRSKTVRVLVSTQAVLGTSYSGPRLELKGEIFETRPLEPKEFPPGIDLFLRYRLTGAGWKFDGARRRGPTEWSDSVIDVPARVEWKNHPQRLNAVPLVPDDFAISRATLAQIRAKAHVTLAVRRGRLGGVWVESGVQTGDALGTVTGLIDRTSGALLAFGSLDPRLEEHAFSTAKAEGWIARFTDGKLDRGAPMSGQPIDSVQLPDGRLQVAMREGSLYNTNGFSLIRIGRDSATSERFGPLNQVLVSLAPDGSVWTIPVNGRNSPGKLIHIEASGTRLAEVPVEASVIPIAVRGDVVLGHRGELVIRFRLAKDRLVETDRWTVEGFSGAFISDEEAVVVGGSKGLFRLWTGTHEPNPLFVPVLPQAVFTAHADDIGNLVISTTAGSSQSDYDPYSQHFWFLPKGGTADDLGDVGPTANSFSGVEVLKRFTKGQRVILRGNDLYIASGSQILGFDLGSKALALRIDERALAAPRRIL